MILKDAGARFTIVTCSYMTGPQNNKIIMDGGFKVQETMGITLLDALMFELEKISKGEKSVSCTKMFDC